MKKPTWRQANPDRARAYQREYQRKYREKYPERRKLYQQRHMAKHGDKRRAEMRARYAKGERYRYHLRAKFGVPLEWYHDTLAAQNGKCAICTTDRPGGKGVRFHVDHCHETGKIRGLLCNSCNHLLGNARDRDEVLSSAAAYLRRSRAFDMIEHK